MGCPPKSQRYTPQIEQIGSVSSLFKRYENVPASLADAALIRLAEINDSPAWKTDDSIGDPLNDRASAVMSKVC